MIFCCLVVHDGKTGFLLNQDSTVRGWHKRVQAFEDLRSKPERLGSIFFNSLNPRVVALEEKDLMLYTAVPLDGHGRSEFWGSWRMVYANDAGQKLYDEGDPLS